MRNDRSEARLKAEAGGGSVEADFREPQVRCPRFGRADGRRLPARGGGSEPDHIVRNRDNNAVVLNATQPLMNITGGLILNGTKAFVIVHDVPLTFVSPLALMNPLGTVIQTAGVSDGAAVFMDAMLDTEGFWKVSDNLNAAVTGFYVDHYEFGTPDHDNSTVIVFLDTSTFYDTISSIYSLENVGDLTPIREGYMDAFVTYYGLPDTAARATKQDIAISQSVAIRNIFTDGNDTGTARGFRYGVYWQISARWADLPSSAGARYGDFNEGHRPMPVYIVAAENAGESNFRFCVGLYGPGNPKCAHAVFSIT